MGVGIYDFSHQVAYRGDLHRVAKVIKETNIGLTEVGKQATQYKRKCEDE